MGKESRLPFTLKCIAIRLHKSFPTWGRISAFFPLKALLSLTTWGRTRSQAFFHLKCKAILPTTGKESCFFPQSASFPSFSPKYNTTLPHKSSLIYREGFFPIQNAKPLQILPYKIFFFFISWFFTLFFIYLYFFFSFLLFPSNFLFLFFTKSWNSSPKWKNYSPAFGANNRRIDAPGVGSYLARFLEFTQLLSFRSLLNSNVTLLTSCSNDWRWD